MPNEISGFATSSRALVFAYGSNMHLGDLGAWMARHGHGSALIHSASPAVLHHFELVWNYHSAVRQAGAANLRERSGARAHGVVLEVNRAGLRAIDVKEGHPHRYGRGHAPKEVELGAGGTANAWVYLVQPEYIIDRPVLPTAHYLALMVEGAESHALPGQYVESLRRMPVQQATDNLNASPSEAKKR